MAAQPDPKLDPAAKPFLPLSKTETLDTASSPESVYFSPPTSAPSPSSYLSPSSSAYFTAPEHPEASSGEEDQESPPAAAINRVWTSPAEQVRVRFNTIHTQATHLGLVSSPFFPKTLSEYLAVQQLTLERKTQRLKAQLRDREEARKRQEKGEGSSWARVPLLGPTGEVEHTWAPVSPTEPAPTKPKPKPTPRPTPAGINTSADTSGNTPAADTPSNCYGTCRNSTEVPAPSPILTLLVEEENPTSSLLTSFSTSEDPTSATTTKAVFSQTTDNLIQASPDRNQTAGTTRSARANPDPDDSTKPHLERPQTDGTTHLSTNLVTDQHQAPMDPYQSGAAIPPGGVPIPAIVITAAATTTDHPIVVSSTMGTPAAARTTTTTRAPAAAADKPLVLPPGRHNPFAAAAATAAATTTTATPWPTAAQLTASGDLLARDGLPRRLPVPVPAPAPAPTPAPTTTTTTTTPAAAPKRGSTPFEFFPGALEFEPDQAWRGVPAAGSGGAASAAWPVDFEPGRGWAGAAGVRR